MLIELLTLNYAIYIVITLQTTKRYMFRPVAVSRLFKRRIYRKLLAFRDT